MTPSASSDPGEIRKFDRLARIWWDPRGPLGTLHTINPLRTRFIAEALPLAGSRILDVGCGGGILTEALARAGAQLTGIDLSEASIEAARRHAEEQELKIEYWVASALALAETSAGAFDGVTCMEMLEHVPEPRQVVAECAQLLRPGGHAFFSTVNRTAKAFLFAILGGEHLLHLLPRGSHNYQKLIRPSELKAWAEVAGLEFIRLVSFIYNPFTRAFRVADREDINYCVHFIKRG
jgi:2-polyprenyl-6-hydroxyphenyl methylase/3-demethylubiquinone-9 3-methyltransferase